MLCPYRQQKVNFMYNLLFCDDFELFRPKEQQADNSPWALLFVPTTDPLLVENIANDPQQESRIRLLAYSWLRQRKLSVPVKKLVGVIVEMALADGLDVLATYEDGEVRYINRSEKMVVVLGSGATGEIRNKTSELLSVSQNAVNVIGTWEKSRLPAPKRENCRMTFLVSDGLCFGEGPIDLMSKDAMAGPIIIKATELLQLVLAVQSK